MDIEGGKITSRARLPRRRQAPLADACRNGSLCLNGRAGTCERSRSRRPLAAVGVSEAPTVCRASGSHFHGTDRSPAEGRGRCGRLHRHLTPRQGCGADTRGVVYLATVSLPLLRAALASFVALPHPEVGDDPRVRELAVRPCACRLIENPGLATAWYPRRLVPSPSSAGSPRCTAAALPSVHRWWCHTLKGSSTIPRSRLHPWETPACSRFGGSALSLSSAGNTFGAVCSVRIVAPVVAPSAFGPTPRFHSSTAA